MRSIMSHELGIGVGHGVSHGVSHGVGHGVGHRVSYKYSLIYFMRTLQDCSQNITTLVQLISMRNSMKIWLARFCFLEVNTVQ